MSKHNNLGYIFVGQDNPDESPPENGRIDMATANFDADGIGVENYEYKKYSGPIVQFRARQSISPTQIDQGFVGNFGWGPDPFTGEWTWFVKVQKDGDKGKETERDHKGQWYKIKLEPHVPDTGSEATKPKKS